MHDGAILGSIPTARNARAGKHRLLSTISLIGGKRVVVQKTRLAGIALFLEDDLDPDQFGFVGQLINKPRMRELHELLRGALAQLPLLFPERVFPDHQGADPLAYQQIDDATAGRVQRAVDPAMALRRDPIQVRRGETVLMAQATLVRCALLVVKLVEAFEGLAADQTGDKPGLGEGRARPGH